MLGWFTNTCHAFFHSPTRERREVSFANVSPPTPGGPSGQPEDEPEDLAQPEGFISPDELRLRQEATRNATTHILGTPQGNVLIPPGGDKKTKPVPPPPPPPPPPPLPPGIERDEPKLLSAEAVKNNAEQTRAKLANIKKVLEEGKVMVREFGNSIPDLDTKWSQAEVLIRDATLMLFDLEARAKVLAEWSGGAVSPQEFLERIRSGQEQYGEKTDTERLEHKLLNLQLGNEILNEEGMPVGRNTAEAWDMLNESSKQERIAKFNKEELQEELFLINDAVTRMDEDIAGRNLDGFKEILSDYQKHKDSGEKGHSHTSFLDKIGIEFYSINNVIAGCKQWFEAWKHAHHDNQELKNRKVAGKIGNMFGWATLIHGDEAERETQKSIDSANKKAVSEYKEYLDKRGFSFKELFKGDNNLLSTSHHDPNKALAILEHAADRGFLYTYTDEFTTNRASKDQIKIFDTPLRTLIPTDYADASIYGNIVNKLFSMNQRGGLEEQEKYQKREAIYDKPGPYIDALNDRFKSLNLWGAIGTIEAALARGKTGYIPATMAAIVMHWIETNEDVRKYMSGPLIERLGFKTFGDGPFTLSYFTMNKNNLLAWKEDPTIHDHNGKRDLSKGEPGLFASTYSKIKQEIITRNGGKEPKKIAEVIGKVLATETVTLESGDSISIFEDQFNAYRPKSDDPNSTFVFDYAGNIKVDPGSADYYNQRSEVLMMPVERMQAVFETDTQGVFRNRQQVQRIMGWALTIEEELQKNPRLQKAAVNFKKEMSDKLKQILKNMFRKGKTLDTSEAIKGDNSRTSKAGVAALYDAGFITIKELQEGNATVEMYKVVTSGTVAPPPGAKTAKAF